MLIPTHFSAHGPEYHERLLIVKEREAAPGVSIAALTGPLVATPGTSVLSALQKSRLVQTITPLARAPSGSATFMAAAYLGINAGAFALNAGVTVVSWSATLRSARCSESLAATLAWSSCPGCPSDIFSREAQRRAAAQRP